MTDDGSDASATAFALSLVPIDRSNWRTVEALRPQDEQADFVSPNAVSILEATFEPDWTAVAIDVDGLIVGHARYDRGGRGNTDARATQASRPAWIGSLMVDARWQGRGFGRMALEAIIRNIKAASESNRIMVTVHPANPAARKLYLGAGFEDTGRLHNGDALLQRDL